MLQIFQLELQNPVKAEALISGNLNSTLRETIFQVEEFRTSTSVQQCYNSAKVLDIRTKIVKPKPNVSSLETAAHIRDAQIEQNQSVLTVKH